MQVLRSLKTVNLGYCKMFVLRRVILSSSVVFSKEGFEVAYSNALWARLTWRDIIVKTRKKNASFLAFLVASGKKKITFHN